MLPLANGEQTIQPVYYAAKILELQMAENVVIYFKLTDLNGRRKSLKIHVHLVVKQNSVFALLYRGSHIDNLCFKK
jgi:hypothetical protein